MNHRNLRFVIVNARLALGMVILLAVMGAVASESSNATNLQPNGTVTFTESPTTFTRTFSVTRSSTTFTSTFSVTHSTLSTATHTFTFSRSFTRSFVTSVIVTTTAVSQILWCNPCIPGCPGYPYNCYPYPYQTITTATMYSYQTVTPVTSYSTSQSAMIGATQLTPAGGATAHDIWLVIAPLQVGQFAIILSAQGLQQNASYLVEGITRGAQMTAVPLATTTSDSELISDARGNGVYWHVLNSDPRVMYGQVLLLYLPNKQLQGSQLVASALLS